MSEKQKAVQRTNYAVPPRPPRPLPATQESLNRQTLTQVPILPTHLCVCVCVSRSVMSTPVGPHGLQPAKLLCPWDSPVKDTREGCHSLLQGIFSTQGSNPGLLHGRQILYCLSYQGSPPTHLDIWKNVKENKTF